MKLLFLILPVVVIAVTELYLEALSRYIPLEALEEAFTEIINQTNSLTSQLKEPSSKSIYAVLISKSSEFEAALSSLCPEIDGGECRRLSLLITDALELKYLRLRATTVLPSANLQACVLEQILYLRALELHEVGGKFDLEYRLAFIKLWIRLFPNQASTILIRVMEQKFIAGFKAVVRRTIRILLWFRGFDGRAGYAQEADRWYFEMTGRPAPLMHCLQDITLYLEKAICEPLYALEVKRLSGREQLSAYLFIIIRIGYLNLRALELLPDISKPEYYHLDWHFALLYSVLEK